MGIFYKQTENQKLLQQSAMLCQSVEPYIEELGLDWNTVRNLRQEIKAMQNINTKYLSLSESFSEFNISKIRLAIKSLIRQCVQSINYTDDLGIILGIESNSVFNSNNFFDSGYSPVWA